MPALLGAPGCSMEQSGTDVAYRCFPWRPITENYARLPLPAQRPPLGLAIATVAAGWTAAFGLAGWIVLYLQNPIHKDFRVFYVAAEAGLRYGWPAIYDVSTLRALSSALPAGQKIIDSQTAFVNPPLFAWIIAPLTAMPLAYAYALWTLVSLAVLVWAWYVTAPHSGLAKLALLLGALAMWPVTDALYYGQPSLVIIALVAASWWLCSHERSVAAGTVLALATALKPQVVILVPFAFLAAGRPRLFISWATGCALLAALFAVTLGPTGVTRWWAALNYLQSDPHHSFFTLAYVVGSGPMTYAAEGLLAAVAVAVAWARRNQLEIVVAAGIVGSLASSIHLHESDYAGLVLMGWLVLRCAPSRWQQAWLVASIVGMQAVTLAQPLPQIVLDAAWLIAVAISGFAGIVESTPATRPATSSRVRAELPLTASEEVGPKD